MVRKTLALGFLTMVLAAPGAHSQTAPAGAAPPAANAVDPAAIQARGQRAAGGRGGGAAALMPVAEAAVLAQVVAAVAMVQSVPPNCVPVNYGGMIYQQCGNTWYQPQGSQYIVVNPTELIVRAAARGSSAR